MFFLYVRLYIKIIHAEKKIQREEKSFMLQRFMQPVLKHLKVKSVLLYLVHAAYFLQQTQSAKIDAGISMRNLPGFCMVL